MIHQPSIVRGVVFPPKEPRPNLRALQDEFDAEAEAQPVRKELPSVALTLWCLIAAAGLMLAMAFGLLVR